MRSAVSRSHAASRPLHPQSASVSIAFPVRREKPHRIAAVPGDGIGVEVLDEAIRVLEQLAANSDGDLAFEFEHFPWGSQYYLEHGVMMAPDALDRLRSFDAILFGAVGSREVPDHITLWGPRLAICQASTSGQNIRPVQFYDGLPSRLRLEGDPALDWVVVRENSEGEYAGIGGRNPAARGSGKEVAVQTSLFTDYGCERIIRFAFDLARSRPRRKLTCVTKSNAQQYGMMLWDEVFDRVRGDYADVETERWLVDAMAARFVMHPETLDVVVASNLNADILSDLGSALAGSLGLAASANFNPERRFPSMFEPVHGSAPDIVGQGIANPVGMIGSAALMLDHLGHGDLGDAVRTAIKATIADGILIRCRRSRLHEGRHEPIVARLGAALDG